MLPAVCCSCRLAWHGLRCKRVHLAIGIATANQVRRPIAGHQSDRRRPGSPEIAVALSGSAIAVDRRCSHHSSAIGSDHSSHHICVGLDRRLIGCFGRNGGSAGEGGARHAKSVVCIERLIDLGRSNPAARAIRSAYSAHCTGNGRCVIISTRSITFENQPFGGYFVHTFLWLFSNVIQNLHCIEPRSPTHCPVAWPHRVCREQQLGPSTGHRINRQFAVNAVLDANQNSICHIAHCLTMK